MYSDRISTMGDLDNSFSLSSLLCQENEASLYEQELEDEHSYMNYNLCFVFENEDEYIENLVQRETSFGSKTGASDDCFTTGASWLKSARSDAVEWIFNTRAIFGFQIHTAYLSVTYFDRFLSKRSIDDGKLWAIRLLSVACLSLAAKMEECRVPFLSEFSTDDYDFENKVIQRMELLVLSTLEWRMGSITPFAYLHYFISKFFGESRPKEIVSRAAELIVAMIKEINLVDHRPSIIAAAAVLAASGDQLTQKAMELKMDFFSSWGSLENENIFSCYNIMQEIEMRKSRTPEYVISSKLSSIHSCFSSGLPGSGGKRKLSFNDTELNCPVNKMSRP